jgi:hypothetical protein
MMGKRFVAYVWEGHELAIRPARPERAWLDAHAGGHAHGCLPMRMANQHGWEIGAPVGFTAIWNGGANRDCLVVLPDEPTTLVASHFGGGIVTIALPAVFRLEPGHDLLLQGPPNAPRRGASPLSGLVEADWLVTSLAMNWQLTEPNHAVRVRKGEPICQVFPVRRAELEEFEPELRSLAEEPELAREIAAWRALREAFREGLRDPASPEAARRWPGHYLRGEDLHGRPAAPDSHRTRQRLAPFRDLRDAAGTDEEG